MPTPSKLPNSRLRDSPAQLKAEVLRRILQGQSLRATCAAPAMPRAITLYRWKARDAAFAAALEAAQRLGARRRALVFREDQARAFLVRLAAGERLGDISRDPAMPGSATVRRWRLSQGEFGAEVRRLIKVRCAERLRAHRHGAVRLEWTEALADRALLWIGRGQRIDSLRQIDPALPSAWVLQRWRRERPDFDYAVRANIQVGRFKRVGPRMEAATQPLLDGIVQGGSINTLGGQDGLPGAKTLYRWLRRNPELADQVAQACEDREMWYMDDILDIVERVGPGDLALARRMIAPLTRRLGQLKNRPRQRWRPDDGA